ncbi:exosome component 10-like [Penaeus japonicus]|uniref:exosome component 10-like n=1 Tax=Penaeus japonicus TaxID=27405 RepID=UPI001C717619|nr:exosome component 10-like [Penaeus japonicus]
MKEGEESDQEAFLRSRSLDQYVKTVMTHIRGCQKLSTELQGWHHYGDYVGVRNTMREVNTRISNLITNIFQHQDIKLKLTHTKLLDQFDMVREGNDALLERINSDIDEASGLKKDIDFEPTVKRVQAPASTTSPGKNVVLMASRNVQKPQLFFKEKVDNSKKEPFIPIITEKPNSLKPLSILICVDGNQEYYSHPYEYELNHWMPDPAQLEKVKPRRPRPLGQTPLTMVTEVQQLEALVEELKKCSEIAVDLEHHAFRSYQGLACLIQVSTRTKDYLIDPLALRGQLTILNEVFTNPKITKVLHGADFDILWLQRDCGVYVVNMFDTHQASVVLEYPHRSLAALLSKFCDIQANKVYQRADWRIRPLPEDFMEYARQDSHYLLYIYDLMRNELIERGNRLNNLITAVYSRSVDICLKRYEKPFIGPDSHMDLYRRSRKAFDSKQMYALRELYLWRDNVAREQDESPDYVLPKHMLLQIAEVLPKEMQGVLACCNPIPPLVKTELLTIHTIIRAAREQKLQLVQEDSTEGQLPPVQLQMEELNTGLVISKHDLSTVEENPRDLPTLLNPRETLLGDLFSQPRVEVKIQEISGMFGCEASHLRHKGTMHTEITKEFMSPYERYTAYQELKPHLEGERKKRTETVDQAHIDRVKKHFLSLNKNTPQRSSEEEVEESVQQKSSEEEMAEEKDDAAEKKRNKAKIKKQEEKKRKSIPLSLGEEIQERKAANNAQKKRVVEKEGEAADEETDESPSKRLKTNEADVQPEEGAAEKKEGEEEDGECMESDKEDEESPAEEGPSGANDEGPAAFDYDKADYSIFEGKLGKKFKHKQKYSQKFRGRGGQRGRGFKSNMKSFSFGRGKKGTGGSQR